MLIFVLRGIGQMESLDKKYFLKKQILQGAICYYKRARSQKLRAIFDEKMRL